MRLVCFSTVVRMDVTVDLAFQMPCSMLIVGPSGSGKTFFVKQLLENMESTFSKVPARIIWAYSSYQPMYDELSQNVNIEFVEGIPANFNDENLFPRNQHNLLVVDDSMDVGGNHEELMKAFTEYRHHKKLSVFYLLQNLFNQGKHSRTISLNTNYMVLFKSPRDKMQIRVLAQQMYPGLKKFFLESYEDATREPYTYLIVDLRPNCPEPLRLRSGILPGEWPVVYQTKK